MAELERRKREDPVFRAELERVESERAERTRLLRVAEQPVVKDLRALGLDLDSVWDLYKVPDLKSLYNRFQNLAGSGKYAAFCLVGLMVGILADFVPGPLFGAGWIFPVMGLLLSLPVAYQSESDRKHPKRPPPLGPPTRRSPF